MNPFNSLREVKELAINELKKNFTIFGLTVNYEFEWNTRKRAAGICSSSRKTIELSTELVSLNLNKPEFILNTILHEIAHAICNEKYGRCGHNATWKRVARSIGCDGQRCYESAKVETPKGKYVYVCPNCSKETHRHKRITRSIACGDCCRKYNYNRFDSRFILVPKDSVRIITRESLFNSLKRA